MKYYMGRYPAIGQWLRQTGTTLTELGKRTGLSASCINHTMKGKDLPNKYTIDKILAVTGLTYEEAFRREEGENNE